MGQLIDGKKIAQNIQYQLALDVAELKKSEEVTGGDYDYFTIGITMSRDELYRCINKRVDDMVSRGLLDELKNVLAMGYNRELPSLDTVGYKEWFPYLDSMESFEQSLENVKRDTRRYAKRQMTWFRSMPDIQWIDALDIYSVEKILEQVKVWLNS